MFQGFTQETSDYFWELSFNNERLWFLEHKAQFERVVNEPFKMLANDVFALMKERYPKLDCQLHVARIYRDARRLHGRGPYKDHLWFSIKSEAALLEGPMFWFELGAKDFGYGMGFYSATAEQMAAYRANIDANPARFERLARGVEKLKGFSVSGEEYKKSKGEREGLIGKWYNRRRVGVDCEKDFGGELLSPELPALLADTYSKLMPMYEFFMEAYQAGEDKP